MKSNKLNKNKKFKRILMLTGVYAVLSAIISFFVIYYVNNLSIVNINNIIKKNTNNSIEQNNKSNISVNKSNNNSGNLTLDNTNLPQFSKLNISEIPINAINLSFSYDGQFCVFLYNNDIYIKNINSNVLIKKISKSAPITNFILMNDRNIIIFFTLKNNLLEVRTYDISNDNENLQKTIQVPSNSKIKNIDYSALTNLIFFDLESGIGSSLKDTLYYLNIMKKLKTIQLQTTINNMVLLNKTFNLYYENNQNILCSYPTPLKEIKGVNIKQIHLIGCDESDNLYIQSLEDKHIIYILKNENLYNVKNLNDLNYIKFYVNKIGVYVVYKDYLINLVNDINKKFYFDRNLNFISISGNKIYFKDQNYNIYCANLDI
jgi:hypothetical protein